eukprot:g25409.t1
MNQAGKTTWVECFSGKGAGTGGVSYATAEEAANAITMLNGSDRGSHSVGSDRWMARLARVSTEEDAAYQSLEEEACCLRCCRGLQRSLASTEGRRQLLLGAALTLVALMVLRGPLLDLLGFVLKVCEYFLKPLLLVTDVVPPPAAYHMLDLQRPTSQLPAERGQFAWSAYKSRTAAYLCYKDPNTACLFVVLLLAGGGYFLASVTIWYKPIDASKDFLQLSDDHPIGPVALNGLGLP